MAKIRRVVRKVKPLADTPVEERLWPIYVALVLFGGFLMGVTLYFVRFDDRLSVRQTMVALICLPLIPVLIGALMLMLYFINTRWMRRGVQLAMVLSVIAHFFIFLWMYGLAMPALDAPKNKQSLAKRPEKTIQLVLEPLPQPQPQQRDFEKPVETQEPVEQPQEIDKKEPDPEQVKQPDLPQPKPEEQEKPKPTPQATERAAVGETAPRFSDSTSKLSKQSSKLAPTTNRSADAPQVAVNNAQSQVKPEVAVAKQSSEATPTTKPSEVEPSTTQASKETQVARREPKPEVMPDSTAAPVLEKKTTQPTTAPPTAIAKVETPSATKATDSSEITPRTVSPEKQATAAPQVAQATTQPSPETPTEIKPNIEKRALTAEKQPTLASAAESVPIPRTRDTARPNMTAVASATPTADTPQQSSTNETAQPKSTAIAKSAGSTSAPTEVALSNVAADPSAPPAPASTVKRTTPLSPTNATESAVVSSPAKSATKPGLAASSKVDVANPTTAAASSSGEISPTSIATAKQATESPQSAPAAGAPSAASVAGTATSSPGAVAATKRPSAESAPTLAQNDKAAGSGKSSSKQALNVASTVDASAANAGAQVAADATAIGPSSAQVARQESNSPGATTSRQPLESESLSTSTQIASSNANKASAASQPTILPGLAPSASPARASRSAEVAASPTKVESPSLAATSTGQGDPLAQPARMALTKSLAGTAGVGQSANLDRSLPAAESPSLVASGSARRETATQNTPEGLALSPSSTAVAGRSQASNTAPSSSLKADTLENASQSGSEQVAQLDAAAGASVSKQSSNAPQGKVSASPGHIEVDLGPTQVVADSGASSRASGGGQPTINSQSQSKQLARRKIGGSPAAALATDKVAEIPEAPTGTGGGAPKSLDVNTKATAIARTDAGGAAAISGAPSAAPDKGPATEVSAASLVGDAAVARNDKSAPGGAPQAAGQPQLGDHSQVARTVGRTAGGAPQLAAGGPIVADVPNIPRGDGGQPAGGGEAQPAATSVAKAGGGGSAVAAGGTGELALPSTGGTIAATSAGRAEATETAPGAPSAGGGQAAPARRAGGGPALAANTVADVPTVGGAPNSGGATEGTPVASSGVQVAKQSGGPIAGTAGGASAATPGEPGESGGTAQPGAAVAQRASGGATNGAPTATASSGSGAPGRRASKIAVAGASSAVADVVGGGTEVARAGSENPLSGMDRGQLTRQEVTGAIPVNVAADEGPGGLGSEVAMDVGINSRRASAESLDVQVKDARFIRQKVGGDLNINTSAIVSSEGFRKRGPEGRGGGGGSNAPQTEQSVELGLVYLQRHQLADGSWSLQGHDKRQRVELSSDTAATALSLLAFQGAGYNHREHKYKDVVAGGVNYLVKNQQKNGDLFIRSDDDSNSSAWLYSHALGTLALCEAYGMTGDPALREPAQKAIDFIVASQSKELGGWRYRPREMSDTSVTGWMMIALKSGELADLDVPAATYAGVQKWLNISSGGAGKEHLFRYDPNAPDTLERRHGRVTTKTMTSVGLLMRLYLGWPKESAEMRRGADFLLQNPPHVGTVPLDEGSIAKAQRDTYYWYYTTLVMWHMGGEYRERWLAQIQPLLLRTQVQTGPQAGSWDPIRPEPDRWGLHAGRLYVTTMNLLSLEVRYRYLPIYANENAAR